MDMIDAYDRARNQGEGEPGEVHQTVGQIEARRLHRQTLT